MNHSILYEWSNYNYLSVAVTVRNIIQCVTPTLKTFSFVGFIIVLKNDHIHLLIYEKTYTDLICVLR